MDEQGRRTRGEHKKAGVVAVAVILVLCLLAIMSYRSSHSISGASCSSAITEDSGATSAKHMVALEVTAGNQTASGITAKSQMARASTVASQTTAKTTAASCIVEETFEFGTLRGSAEAVALFKKSLQTGEPYYLNGEPTPVYKAQAGKTITVNPTSEQILVDVRHFSQELREGKFDSSGYFDMIQEGWFYGPYISGGYSDTARDGRKWLRVSSLICYPDAVVPGIEQIDHSKLFDLKFPVRKSNSSFAMSENAAIMYERYGDWLIRIYDYRRGTVRIVTKGGVDRAFQDVIPGSALLEQGWGGSVIFAYQAQEGNQSVYKLFRLTRGTITALYEEEEIVGMVYDDIGVYALFHDGRNPPEIYLAIRDKNGIRVQSLGGVVIGTVSEAEYRKQGIWFFSRELSKTIRPSHAEAVGAEWNPHNWRTLYNQKEWTWPTDPTCPNCPNCHDCSGCPGRLGNCCQTGKETR